MFVTRIRTDRSYAQFSLERSLAALISMGPTSQSQWIEDNPNEHIDRFQRVAFHYLAVEYGLGRLASLPGTDKLYFARVGVMYCMYSYVSMYVTYHGKIGPDSGGDLERELRRYYNLSIGMSYDILGIASEAIIFRILLAYMRTSPRAVFLCTTSSSKKIDALPGRT